MLSVERYLPLVRPGLKGRTRVELEKRASCSRTAVGLPRRCRNAHGVLDPHRLKPHRSKYLHHHAIFIDEADLKGKVAVTPGEVHLVEDGDCLRRQHGPDWSLANGDGARPASVQKVNRPHGGRIDLPLVG